MITFEKKVNPAWDPTWYDVIKSGHDKPVGCISIIRDVVDASNTRWAYIQYKGRLQTQDILQIASKLLELNLEEIEI